MAASSSLLKDLISSRPTQRIQNMLHEACSQLIPCAQRSLGTMIPELSSFIMQLVCNARLKSACLLVALVYLKRLQKCLPPTAQGMYCTRHRILLASLILSDKYLRDTPLRNKSWAVFGTYFSLAEVNLMERQLLYLMNYNLQVTDEELDSTVQIMFHATQPCILSTSPEPESALHSSTPLFRQKIQTKESDDSCPHSVEIAIRI